MEYPYAQVDGANYVRSVTTSTKPAPVGSNIIPLPEYRPEILDSLYEGGVFKDGPGGTVIYDPTP